MVTLAYLRPKQEGFNDAAAPAAAPAATPAATPATPATPTTPTTPTASSGTSSTPGPAPDGSVPTINQTSALLS